ncbi:MAG: DUF1559 domain-containing protein [Phycisphaerales bacterium]|jgi:prepilin-type processing-associated H-X9-DG protein|nr:DUF1559 domain-containing protein [Phycisphaerales bacterium]
MRKWIAVVVCWVWVGIAFGQGLDQHVPGEGTVVYLQWKGTEALREPYNGSRLKKVVDQSNLPALFSEFLPRVVEKIKKESPLDAQVLGNWLEAMELLGQHPTAIWWGGFAKATGQRPLPRLAVVCEAGDGAAGLREKLIAALGDNAQKWAIQIDQGWVSITPVPYAEQFQRELKDDHSLAKEERYQHAKSLVMGDAALLAYVNGENLAGVMEQDKSATEFIAASGLNGLKSGIVTSGFDGADWRCEAFIDAPAPRTGLLSLLDGPPLPDELLDRVPASALGLTTARLSLPKLLNEIRTALGKVDPKAQRQFNKMLGFATMSLGVNVETDLIASFGDQWLTYDDPQSTGGGVLGTVLLNHLAEPAKGQQSLDALARLANSVLAGQLRNTPATVSIRQVHSDDLTISYLPLPAISPAWTIKDGFLYLSLYPEVAAQAARTQASAGNSIRNNETFIAMKNRLGVTEGIMSMGFHNLPKSASRAYPVVLLLSRTWLGVGDLLGLESPELILPPLEKIIPQLTPAGSVSWTNDSGWHYRAISPFPLSGIFGGEWGALASQSPLLMTAILPAFQRSRESTRETRCLNQMRQLGMAFVMYANDHKGQLPPDLGSLLPYLNGNALLMICPDMPINPNSIPADAAGRAKWVDEHSSYEYLLPNVKLASIQNATTKIMVRENSSIHGGKMNVIFADGHAQGMWPYEVENLMDADKAEDHTGE